MFRRKYEDNDYIDYIDTPTTGVIKASQVLIGSPYVIPSSQLHEVGTEVLETSGLGKGIMCGRTDFCPIK